MNSRIQKVEKNSKNLPLPKNRLASELLGIFLMNLGLFEAYEPLFKNVIGLLERFVVENTARGDEPTQPKFGTQLGLLSD